MERLTKKAKNNKIHSHEPTDYGNDKDRTDLLGEYEDTGLTPEEIQKDIRIHREMWEEKYFALRDDRDYWKAEALKHCARLGEIKLLMGRSEG